MHLPRTLALGALVAVGSFAFAGCAASPAAESERESVSSVEEQCANLKRQTDKIDGALKLVLSTQDASGRATLVDQASEHVDAVEDVALGGDLATARDEYADALNAAFPLLKSGNTGADFSAAVGNVSSAQVDMNSICGWSN